MAVFRRTLTTIFVQFHGKNNHSVKDLLQMNRNQISATTNRYFSRQSLSKSLELLSVDKVNISTQKNNNSNAQVIVTEKPRPMVVMLAWMLAEKKHLAKYAEVYLNRGIDVLTVHVTPWQLLWPVSGSQVVAKEILQFLHYNPVCRPLYLHGFSVGAYIWAEVMVKMNKDLKSYQPIIDGIVAQAWDSAADVTELDVGLPHAVFPNNPIIRSALKTYVRFHLKAFYNIATTHYMTASNLFFNNPVQCPALLLVSKSDLVVPVSSNIKLRDTWKSKGIKTHFKCWEDSKHVSHFLKYKDDYIETLENFLDSITVQEDTNVSHPVGLREKMQLKL